MTTSAKIIGYVGQDQATIDTINDHKRSEEILLRLIDGLVNHLDPRLPEADPRWLAIARTHFEQGFMALNRALLKPERVNLPGE